MYRYNSTFKVKESSLRRIPGTARLASKSKLRPRRKTHEGTEAKLKQALTILVSKYVRRRDPFCIIDGKPTTEAAHLFHRDMPATEFDLENVWGNCHSCNSRNEYQPEPMRLAVLERLGPEKFRALEVRAHSSMKFSYIELLSLRDEMKRKVRNG